MAAATLAVALVCVAGAAHAQDAAAEIDAANRNVVQLLNKGQRKEALSAAADALKRAEAALGERNAHTLTALQNYAYVLQGLGRAADALPHYERALKLNTEMLGERHADTLISLHNYADALRAAGRAADAVPHFERALKLRGEVLGESNAATLTTMNNYAFALHTLKRGAEALPLLERHLKITSAALGEKHAGTLGSLNNFAFVLGALERHEDALRQYERALAISNELWGEKHPGALQALGNYAGALAAAGRAAESLPHYERAWTLRRDAEGEQHPRTLAALNSYFLVLHRLGRTAEALPHAERALKLRTEAQGEKHPDTIGALSNYAFLLGTLGRTAEGLPYYERAARLNAEALGEKHPDTLVSLNNYAFVLGALGRAAEALPVYERVLKLNTEVLGEKHPATLRSLNNYGEALRVLGRLPEALATHERAFKLRGEALGERHADTLSSRTNYAGALIELGRPGEAQPHYEQVYKARSAALGEKHPDTLIALNNYASGLRRLGRAGEALPHFERALKLNTEVLGERHPVSLIALNNFADALDARGRASEALEHHARALSIRSTGLGEQHPDTLVTLNNYANLLERQGRAADALPFFERYVAGAEAQRDAAGADSAESQRGVLGSYLHGYHNYLTALQKAGRVRDTLAVLERTKARTLLEQMALRSAAAGSGLPDAEAKRLTDYANRIGALDTRIAQTVKEAERDALKAERNIASRELAELKRALQIKYPRFRQITDVQLATADDARTLIAANSVFVSYVVMSGIVVKAITVDASGAVNWFDLASLPGLPDTVEALRMWSANLGVGVMTDDTGRTIQILRWMDGKVARWRVVAAGQACSAQQLQQDQQRGETRAARGLDAPAAPVGNAGADCIPPGATFVSREAQYQELVDYLAKVLIEPLKAQLAGKTQIIISPDGPLGLLPWDVLPLDGKPLIAQFEVSQVQSLSVLKLLKERQIEYGKAGGREALLAMGNPEYGNAASSANRGATVTRSPMRAGANPVEMLRNLKWAALPGTQTEMDQAAKIFAGSSRVISGRAANETTLRAMSAKGELANYRYLHFAAHGYFDPNFPAYSSLVLAPEGPEPERDGYVTVGEWVGMNLKSELTLLSACNTARGENVSGEGLMGLSYALYVAGNMNTVLTLWPVADDETAEFVSSLLTKIKAGQTHVQAITATKREFMNHVNPRKRNPYFWAPFVLYGV